MTYDSYRNRYFLTERQLIDCSPDPQTGITAKAGQSPYPYDARLVENTDFTRWQERYSREVPTVYWIFFDLEKSLPLHVWDEGLENRLYSVDYCDFDLKGKFKAEFFYEDKRDPTKVVRMVWRPENASVGQAQWDVMLYSPVLSSHTDWPLAGPNHFAPGKGLAIDGPGDYVAKHMALDWKSCNPKFPYCLWESSQGHLLWTIRIVTDVREISYPRLQKRLVLLDSYDRLVAMEYIPVPTFSEARDVDDKTADPDTIAQSDIVVAAVLHSNGDEKLLAYEFGRCLMKEY
ncbi:hypothetical protein NQ176_g5296 [Zarea fungicola]|uniref:Uncharacterized protein n=1 Tax=Zarea fungicola TaxID=93591 RepID=A0ACC1NAL3_9HYPO|nr:hypothetical protein NQ176_g5296 [Lecanicillium fungicola]